MCDTRLTRKGAEIGCKWLYIVKGGHFVVTNSEMDGDVDTIIGIGLMSHCNNLPYDILQFIVCYSSDIKANKIIHYSKL